MDYKSIIIIFFLFVSLSFAQQTKFTVEQFTIDGELTMEDLLQPEFGKFDPYEFYLNQGDRIRIELTAAFPQMLVIIAPSEQSKVLYPENGNDAAIYDSEISESGTWFVYVVGDSSDVGAYQIFARYTSKDFIRIAPNQDFCANINFVLTHTRAELFFLENRDFPKTSVGWESNTLINGAVSASVIEGEKNIYEAVMYEGDIKEEAELVYNYVSEKLKNCLTDWEVIEKKMDSARIINFVKSDDAGMKEVELKIFTEPNFKVLINIFAN
ncbi:MAG: hypothetical protein V1720_02000 [bacterium]